MMSFDAWPVAVKLTFLIMPFVISLAGIAMNVYITLTRDYDVVCSSITSNSYVEALKVTWGTSSFKWRFLLVCTIGNLINFPGFVLRRGQVDAEELKAFPAALKRRLAISAWLTIIGFGWLTVAALVMKFSKMN
ncbi:hypothetical protein I5S86_16935 [Priestia aryabhattai]|nr:hypothetical protein I5S86_16935 [Priestia aryabhattai]